MVKAILIAAAVFVLIWLNKIRIYLKWEKKKRRNVAPFYRWPETVHKEPVQVRRIQAARSENFVIRYQDEEKGLAQIQGEGDPELIWCNLGMCRSCYTLPS